MSETGARLFDRQTPPVLVTLILITSIAVLTMNALVPSLPRMAEDLETSYTFMQWALSGYLAMTAAMQLVVGPLSDRYGRRPIVIGGLIVFILASIGCVLSKEGETFMAFRMLQAAVASGMVLSRTIVRDLLPPREAASMIGYMTAAMALVPMVGPLYGGAMEEALGWRATFWSFVLLGSGVLWLVWIDLGETNSRRSSSFRAQFRAYPGLLSAPRFWGYSLTGAFASGSFFALLGGAPFVAREIFGLGPSATGLYLGFIAFGYLCGSLVTGRFGSTTPTNRMMLLGCLASLIGLSLGVLTNIFIISHPLAIFGFCIFVGFGNGMTLPSSTTGLMSVRAELAGSASGLGAAMMIGAGAALAAVTAATLTVESGPLPLLLMMLGSAVMSVLMALFVIYRTRQVEGIDD